MSNLAFLSTTAALCAYSFSSLLAAPPDKAPAFEWATAAGGLKNDKTRAINIDTEGNVFFVGEATGDGMAGDTFRLGGAELHSRGATDVYVAKFDAQGALRWITQAGGDKGDNAYTMVCDGQGNLYLGGSFGGTATFDEASITSTGSNDLDGAKLKAK